MIVPDLVGTTFPNFAGQEEGAVTYYTLRIMYTLSGELRDGEIIFADRGN